MARLFLSARTLQRSVSKFSRSQLLLEMLLELCAVMHRCKELAPRVLRKMKWRLSLMRLPKLHPKFKKRYDYLNYKEISLKGESHLISKMNDERWKERKKEGKLRKRNEQEAILGRDRVAVAPMVRENLLSPAPIFWHASSYTTRITRDMPRRGRDYKEAPRCGDKKRRRWRDGREGVRRPPVAAATCEGGLT